MQKLTLYIDGKYVKVTPEVVAAFTPGHFKARGVFETMLAVGNKVFDVDAHLKRLRQGLAQLRIAVNVAALPAVIRRVVKINGHNEARVRVMVWQDNQQAHVAVMALKHSAPSDKSLRACFIHTDRAANSRLANRKSLDYQLFADACAQAKAKGFDEALLLNRKGNVFESSRANIFWIKDQVLYTPPLSSGCLNGITRQAIIKQARLLKIPFKERNITPALLKDADEVFLTNSLLGIKMVQF